MLEDADCVGVGSVDILPEEVPLLIGFVEGSKVFRIDAHLDDLLHKFRQVREWKAGFVEEPLLGRTLHELELELLRWGCGSKF